VISDVGVNTAFDSRLEGAKLEQAANCKRIKKARKKR